MTVKPSPVAPAHGAAANYRFAIVTPSYYVDFEHCRWLCETVARYVPSEIAHYLVVDRADAALFARLASSRTRVLFKEDVLRGRLYQLPFRRRWWIGKGPYPVRGWIVQQAAKLCCYEVLSEDVLMFVDSGAFFVRPYDPRGMIRNGLVPLFREQGPYYRGRVSMRWHRNAAKLLGIRPQPNYDFGYVKTLVTWRRDNVCMLHEHVARVTGRPLVDSLIRALTFSEYYLYGSYCDLILGERSGHYHTSSVETFSHWSEQPLTIAELGRLREMLAPEHVLVMVNEKSRTSLEAIRQAFR